MTLTKQVVEMSEYTSFIVYKHTSPNGKVYIGITQQAPSKRFGNGDGYKNNEHFWHAIEKYGWRNFKHEILYSGLSKEIACKTEIDLIAKYNSTDGKYGYNISLGGDHSTPSEETRKKLSEAHKNMSEETRKRMSDAHKGKTHSEETRRKLSEANKGRVISKETRKKMSEANKISHKGRIHSEEERRKISASRGGHPVMCVETGIVYESIRDAERQTGINSGNVSLACNGHRKTAGGLHWKFIIKEE